jgi:hypothetical protein
MGVVMAAIIGACMVASPAFAEFEGHKEASKGKGENIELRVEAGGAKVACKAFGEASSSVAWTIESEGKASAKGPSLVSDIEKWGECTAESSELKETKAELSSCELELKQAKSESEVLGKLDSTCVIHAGECEIKAEAKENESLKYANLYFSGPESETLLAEPHIGNLATTTKGTCPGIKATKEGKWSGFTELKQVRPGGPQPEFVVTATRLRYDAANREGIIKVTNRGAAAQRPLSWTRAMRPGGSFTVNAAQEAACEVKVYAVNESCEFAVKWELAGSGFWTIYGPGNFISSNVLLTGE